MPNASDYRAAGSWFRTLGEGYQRQAAAIAGWPLERDVVAEPVTTALGGSLWAAASRLRAAAAEALRLAAVCDRRAEICDDYQRRLDRWRTSSIVDRLFTDPPSPPFPWVSA